jgi:hypothetical protein
MTLGQQDQMLARFPQHQKLVKRLSHASVPTSDQ